MDTPTNLLESKEKSHTREDLNCTLLLCCREGDVYLIPTLIKDGADVRALDENGLTPLLVSALYGHTLCAQELIAAGADVEDLDNRRNTPLIICALRGWASMVSLLIESGADVNAVNVDGDTPLIVSSSTSYEVAKLLIDTKRINIDHKNIRGYTALMASIEAANITTIKMLIEAGSHLEEQTLIKSSDSEVFWQWKDVALKKGIIKLVTLFHLQKSTGKPSLLIAALNGDLNSVKVITTMESSIRNESKESFVAIVTQYIESFSENKKMVSKNDLDILQEILRWTKWLTLTLQDQGSVMNIAIAIGNYEILTIFADRNFSISCANLALTVFDPNMVEFLFRKFNLNDNTMMNNLLKEAVRLGHIDSAKILTKQGGLLDIEESLREAVEHAQTVAMKFIVEEFDEARIIIQNSDFLHIAVKGSSVDVIGILLDCGAEVIVNKAVDGKYPLELAKDWQVTDLLLSRGADANVILGGNYRYPLLLFVSEFFKTALQVRYSESDESFLNKETVEIVKSLLRHGGRLDMRNDKGQTALHVAAERKNSKDILNLLIESGINLNATDLNGWTALHVAVFHSCTENVKCLIEAGTDLEITGINHRTAFFEISDPKILEVFLQFGVDVNTVEAVEGNTLLLDLIISNSCPRKLLKALIAAGSDLNHRNFRGTFPLLVEASYQEMHIVKLLVDSGADLNISTQDAKNRTVITELLQNLVFYFKKTKECIVYCLDHGADLSMLDPCVIHALISSGCLSLVPRFLSFGLAPVHLTMQNNSEAWRKTFPRNISPLVMALLLNHANLAQYFINIKYLMRSDLSVLSGNSHFEQYIESENTKDSHELVKRISLQPLRLETLSFIVVSDVLGSTRDRSSIVRNLRLPQLIQDSLMFRNVEENPFEDSSRNNRDLYHQSLERYVSYDDYDDVGFMIDDLDDEEIDEEDTGDDEE